MLLLAGIFSVYGGELGLELCVMVHAFLEGGQIDIENRAKAKVISFLK